MATPLYLQVKKLLREAIESGAIKMEEAIPTERELAENFDISRITVRKAIEGLVDEGFLTKKRGAGTFVSGERVEKLLSKLSSFSEDMVSRGRTPSSKWLSRSSGIVTPEEAMSLGLSPGSTVLRFRRIRYADGVSMAIEQSAVPGFCLASENSVEGSLYEALELAGYRPVRALQRLRAIAFTSEQAKELGIEPGMPGLFIERRGYMADGRVTEFTRSYYRGDAYDLVSELGEI